MKRKVISLLLSTMLVTALLSGCGGGGAAADAKTDAAPAPAPAAAEEKPAEPAPTKAAPVEEEKEEEAEEETAEEETEEEEAVEEEGEEEEETAEEETEEETEGSDAEATGFSLLDVDESMVDVGVYGNDSNGTELVFTMFTGPDSEKYVSLFAFDNNEQSGDVICGTYTAETEKDEDGIDWTYLSVDDAYTGNTYELGVGEDASTGEVVFFNSAGDVVEGEYLDASDTIAYMASAVNVLSGNGSSGSGEEEATGFSLLDVDESMVEVGVYGNDNNGTELVFTMFTGPDSNKYVSLFAFDNNEQSGDVICGTYTAETEKDEDGIDWTYLTVDDAYTGNTYELGVGEDASTGEVVFFNSAGDVVEGEYLDASDTIAYMGSAVNVLRNAS